MKKKLEEAFFAEFRGRRKITTSKDDVKKQANLPRKMRWVKRKRVGHPIERNVERQKKSNLRKKFEK